VPQAARASICVAQIISRDRVLEVAKQAGDLWQRVCAVGQRDGGIAAVWE